MGKRDAKKGANPSHQGKFGTPAVVGLAVACATAAWLGFGAPAVKLLRSAMEVKRICGARKSLSQAVARGRERLPAPGVEAAGGEGAVSSSSSNSRNTTTSTTDFFSAIQRSLGTPGQFRVESLSIRVEKTGSQADMPVVVYSPRVSEASCPAVIVIHATGGSKASVEPILKRLARMGFVAAAFDCRYHGGRSDASLPRGGYEEGIIRAYEGADEKPFLLDNVWDAQHLIDYLGARKDVDESRIGMTGISLGGMITWFSAALDERVAAAAPLIGVQGWKWAVEHNQWLARTQTIPRVFEVAAAEAGKEEVDKEVVRTVWNRILPGLLDHYDAPQSLPCIAPRPLLVLNGEEDPRCPVGGLTDAVEATMRRYQALGSPDNFEMFLQEKTGHKATDEMYDAAYKFFEEHLRPVGGDGKP